MLDKIKRLRFGGAKPKLTMSERALLISQLYAQINEHSLILESEMKEKRDDMDATQARLTAMASKPPVA